MINEDFERGREFQRATSELSWLAGRILVDDRMDDKPSISPNVERSEYILLRAYIDRLERLNKEHYPQGNSRDQATINTGELARKAYEKRLGPEKTDLFNKAYQEFMAKMK